MIPAKEFSHGYQQNKQQPDGPGQQAQDWGTSVVLCPHFPTPSWGSRNVYVPAYVLVHMDRVEVKVEKSAFLFYRGQYIT